MTNTKILSVEHKWGKGSEGGDLLLNLESFTEQRRWTLQLAPGLEKHHKGEIDEEWSSFEAGTTTGGGGGGGLV